MCLSIFGVAPSFPGMEGSEPQAGNSATEPDTMTTINRTESFDSTVSETGAVPGGLVFWDLTGNSVRTRSSTVRALTDQASSELLSSPSPKRHGPDGEADFLQREMLTSHRTDAQLDVWAGIEAHQSPSANVIVPKVDVQRDGWMDDGPDTASTVENTSEKASPRNA